MVLRGCAPEKSIRELVEASDAAGFDALFLSPFAASKLSLVEVRFAFYLANKAFGGRKNISGKRANEALLFLACETNFASAAKKIGASDSSDFVLVAERNVPLSKLKRALGLGKAKRMKLPEWGKKEGSYFSGERGAERMALERIRN